MDYKEKYEQALENFKKIKAANKDNKELVDFIEYKYPELKESEDEKMINFISHELACLRATDEKGSDRYNELTEAIAWLEKQGEQSLEDKVNEAMREVEEKTKAFTAKHKGETTEEILAQMRGEWENGGWSEEDDIQYYGVIETEQYMLDVVNGVKPFAIGDEQIREACTKELAWLKSLRERIQFKQEWSEEDEIGFDDTLWAINQARTIAKDENDRRTCWSAKHWLKSLKERMKGE